MANEFKIKKGLIVTGASGGTVVDIQGSQGQLFSVTDDLSGSIFAVSDISGVPIFDVNSSGVSYFDGNLGIGTTDPGDKLEVVGNIRLRTSLSNTETVYISTNARGGGTADADLRLGNSINGDVLTVHNANVGIGTTSPGFKLDVNSSDYVAARIESTSSGFAPASILLESGNSNSRGQGIYQYNSVSKNSWFSGVPYSTTSDDWIIAHKLETTSFNADVAQMSNALFCVNDNGNVGIGTDSPDAPLHVLNDSSANVLAKIRIQGGSASGYGDIGMLSGYIRLFSNGSMCSAWTGNVQYNYINGSAATTLNSTGFGIGTTSPQSKLQVAGGIQMADDTATASATKAGTMRYRTGTEYVEVTGTELITNGDFEDGGANWSGNQASPATVTFSNGKMTIVSPNGESAYREQSILTPTKTYRATVDVVVRSGTCKLQWGTGTGATVSVMSATGSYVFYKTIPATGADALFYCARNGACDVDFDNVSVMEVTAEDASYADMCMQTGASTYEWVNIVRNTY